MEIILCVLFRTVDFMHEKFKSYLLVAQMCPCFKIVLIFRCNLEHTMKANWNRVTLPCVSLWMLWIIARIAAVPSFCVFWVNGAVVYSNKTTYLSPSFLVHHSLILLCCHYIRYICFWWFISYYIPMPKAYANGQKCLISNVWQ
jgi:hypothetical protein